MDWAENNIHVTNMDITLGIAYLVSYLSYQWKTRARLETWCSDRIVIWNDNARNLTQ